MTSAPDGLPEAVALFSDPGEEARLSEAVLRRLDALRAASGKACSTCGETKPLSAFHADSRKPDGLRASCRVCRSV